MTAILIEVNNNLSPIQLNPHINLRENDCPHAVRRGKCKKYNVRICYNIRMSNFIWKHFKLLNKLFGKFKWFQLVWRRCLKKECKNSIEKCVII